jgi:hypothetical protein
MEENRVVKHIKQPIKQMIPYHNQQEMIPYHNQQEMIPYQLPNQNNYDMMPIDETVENEKSNELENIHDLIEKKRDFLMKKQKYLSKMKKQNELLKHIHDDYKTYNHYIVQQKKEQMESFKTLNLYLEDLVKSGELTKASLDEAEKDQNKIIREIGTLRRGIKNIMSNPQIQNNTTSPHSIHKKIILR